ncbi:hypothetical protein AURDEDRAFT_58653, partial [Auricularia subglabra TFB-10046 SS5]
ESAHKFIKRANRATNHRNQAAQLASSEQRARRIRIQLGGTAAQKEAADTAPFSAPELSHDIGTDSKRPIHISWYMRDMQDDPAVKGFFVQLKSHLLERLRILPDLPDERYSEALRGSIAIENGKLFAHCTMRTNYTTYDMRRSQDCINPHTSHSDVMMHSPEERRNAHPYWYARVLDIFHVNVLRGDTPAPPPRFNILWIRWFGEDPEWEDGWKKRRLPRVDFVPASDPDAFGFIDPATVLRAAHMLPAYAEGRTQDLLPAGNSLARGPDEVDDFVNYYVGM